jgi:hypothetical protein
MSALLKRLRDAIWPRALAGEYFMSKAAADDIEGIMPGQVLVYTIRGREFVMLEREEFDTVLQQAGYRFVRKECS